MAVIDGIVQFVCKDSKSKFGRNYKSVIYGYVNFFLRTRY